MLEIKEEVSTVSGKQETCSEDLCTLMDTKMTDIKISLGGEMKIVKDKIKSNTTLLSELQKAQVLLNGKVETVNNLGDNITQNANTLLELKHSHETSIKNTESLDERMVTLEDKTSDIEVDIIKQKRGVDQVNQNLSQHISDVEYGLATHIEKVKNNVEIEIAGAKQSQISVETS